jgi:hypothetical protein
MYTSLSLPIGIFMTITSYSLNKDSKEDLTSENDELHSIDKSDAALTGTEKNTITTTANVANAFPFKVLIKLDSKNKNKMVLYKISFYDILIM